MDVQMITLLVAVLASFILTACLTKILIPWLKRLKFRQTEREKGPASHKVKQGTPTMGGIAIAAGVTAVALILGFKDMAKDDMRLLFVVMGALLFGLVGFADDYIKVVKKRNLGLTGKQKIFLQVVVSVAFLAALKLSGLISTLMYIPIANVTLDAGLFYYPIALFIIIGTVNSVNLTDGLDGLVSWVSIPVGIFFAVISVLFSYHSLGVFSSALIGGCLGFLVYNAYPAKVFMGDTGSFFLGGAVVSLAFLYDIPIILVIVGLVYLLEALSDIIQVISFKTTGKRVFKMAPLHHHFELCGLSEKKVVYLFTIISVLCAIAGYFCIQSYFM